MSARVSGRRDPSNLIVCKMPDVCLTPMGSGLVPVPYMSVAFLAPAVRVSTTVFNNGRNDFQLNSRSTRTTGHKPGTGRGYQVPGYEHVSHAKKASPSVFSEGFAVVRDRDEAWVNRPDPGPAEPNRDEGRLLLAGATTTDFRHACRVLGLNSRDASRALHAAKAASGLRGDDNCAFSLSTGDILFGGEVIGNLGD